MDTVKKYELLKRIKLVATNLETVSMVCLHASESIKNLEKELEDLKQELIEDTLPIKTY